MATFRLFAVRFLGLLLAAHAVPVMAAELPGISQPAGDPGAWATSRDYPVDAVLNQQEGTTKFRLTVAGDGVPTNCEVIESAGVASLDARTCDLMMERARFRTLNDNEGKPSVSTYTNKVRWVLPVHKEGFPPRYTLEVTIDRDGIEQKCVIVERTSIYEQSDLCANRVGEKVWSADPARPKMIVRIRQTIEFEIPRE